MSDRINLGIIFGGRSGEHDVSLMSARSILSVLDPQRYAVTAIGITRTGQWVIGEDVLNALESAHLNTLQPAALFADPSRPGLFRVCASEQGEMIAQVEKLDVIFPVLHGTFGEDGTLQGLLEMADVAYVGAGVLGSAAGMDKALFKDVMRAHGIPVVESVLLLRSAIQADMEAALQTAEAVGPYPLFVKPANLGSSVGVSKCRSRADLVEGLLDAARYDRRVLVERGVNAREIEVSVLGNDQPQASLAGEIMPDEDFYSYSSKYLSNNSQLMIPADLPAATAELARELAVRAFSAIDCAGLARVDFLLDRDSGELFLSEVNTIPGFTRISMYPKLWEATGLPYAQLVDRLIQLALERKADRDRTEHSYGRSQ